MTQLRERTLGASSEEPTVRSSRLARLSGLDGLRAVAVAAVVIFHLDVSLAPGGFIGVDIFFVISGFLITRILTDELAETGRIRFGQFYLRRARRLLPAVVLLIGVVVVASSLVWRDELPTLAGSALSSVTYVTNWWLIAAHQSYFVSVGRPPMLQHLWSLAIEEQFYLLWPLLIVLTARVVHRRSAIEAGRPVPIMAIVSVALVLAASSTLTMTLIARAEDVPYGASTSRVYFGTDTHSMGLFLGAAAGAWTIWRQRRPDRARPGAAMLAQAGRLASMLAGEVLALTCFIGLAYIIATVDEFRPQLYQGGFLLIDSLAVVVIMVVVRGGSALGRLLDSPPAVWIGRRSYSIYLWHWPVALVTRPGIDLHGPLVLINLARLGVILLLADASYRFIEQPLRLRSRTAPPAPTTAPDRETAAEGAPALGALPPPAVRSDSPVVRRPARSWINSDGRLALAGLFGLLCVLVLVAAGSPLFSNFTGENHSAAAGVHRDPPASPSGGVDGLSVTSTPAQSGAPTASAEPSADAPTSIGLTPSVPNAAPTGAAAPGAPAAPVSQVKQSTTAPLVMSAFGDSVLLGAGAALRADVSSLSLDAVEGRQAGVVLGDVVTAHSHNGLAPIVLIDTGNNGVISPDQLNATLSALTDRQRVILLTDRVPRDWQDPNNQTLRTVTARFSNVVLIDWLHYSTGHDGWFYQDGYHLNPTGAAAFAALIAATARQ